MTIATYAELIAEVPLWLRRTDLTARIPGFVLMTEAALNRGVRARRRIGRATATINGEFEALPANFGGPRSFKLTTGNQPELRYISPEAMATVKDMETTTSTGEPKAYSVVGDEFEFYPVPAGDYAARLTYLRKLTPLAEGVPANWLLTDHPDVYLAGCLWHGFAFLKNDLATQWEAKFNALIEEINGASVMESMGGVLNPNPSMNVV